MSDELKLLVEWSSPWEEFRSAIKPAFAHSERPLAGEAHFRMFPYQGILAGWGVELLLFLLIFIIPARMSMHTFQPPPPAKYDVIYYSGAELPRVADAGGAQSGRSGRSGGREGFHHTQAIRVARETILRDTVVDAPKLDLPRSNSAVANLLAYRRTPGPPPAEGLKSSRPLLQAPQLTAVAPAPQVDASDLRNQPMLNETPVAPAPAAPQQNLATLRLPGSNAVQVVAPPVSAPEQFTNANPKLSLPRQTVVAPPPSQPTTDLARNGPGYGPGDLHSQVIPPPVQMGNTTGERQNISGLGGNRVVPPPVQMGNNLGGNRSAGGLGGGLNSAVAPAPSLADAASLGGHGRGNRGQGFGAPGELGDVAAPPNGGGNANGTGVVVSNQPGTKTGVPGKGGAGALALSPAGGDTPGLGGSGGGNGIGRGNGSGSGFSGTGSGAGRDGSGYGSDPNARGGTSPFPGPGGTGNNATNNPAIPGVSVSGGNSSIITLPSFSSGANQPTDPSRSSAGLGDRRQEITVEASPRSGGAFNFYGALKGDKVYTIYLDTTLGTAVLEFSDPSSAAHAYSQELTAPQPIRAVLPSGLRRARLVIACVLDRSGILRNPQVLESAAPQLTAKVLAALPAWKFRPALRGNQPVEVNALLGFAIDTSDRY
ncbi:MAG TPA: hypothetical protein VLV49_16315 [Terriglobales bacterium]|nr:hypothetical protein [Terriglobales bacterium]